MKNVFYLIVVCASFISCQKPTQIQIFNERFEEKTTNFGLQDYYSDTGRIRNVERIYVEYGDISEVWICVFRNISSDGISNYEMVDDIIIDRVKANSASDIFEIKNCDKVEVRYFINAYNHYYRDTEKVATEKIVFDELKIQNNIKYGKINKITIID